MKIIILLVACIYLMGPLILFSTPVWAQASSKQPSTIPGTDKIIANDLYQRLYQDEISALEELVHLAENGNVYAVGSLRTFVELGPHNSALLAPLKKSLAKLNPQIYASRAEQGDTEAVYALFNLATAMNSSALEILQHLPIDKFIELANKGNRDVVFLFSTYLDKGQFGLDAKKFFEQVDPAIYIKQARQADKAAVFLLVGLAEDGNVLSRREIFSLAAKGNEHAIQGLAGLIYLGDTEALNLLIDLAKKENFKAILSLVGCKDTKAQEAAKGINPSRLIKQAEEGSWDALRSLYQLSRADNLAAQQGMKSLNPAEFKKQALKGNEEGLMSLRALAEQGNAATLKILEDLKIH